MTKFVQLALAILKGDKAEATTIRNEKLAKSAINGQLAALEGKKTNLEMDVETAEEGVRDAILNIKGESPVLISSAEGYIDSVKRAKNSLTAKKEDLQQINDSIEEWNALKDGEYFQVAKEAVTKKA